jgi:hypothetical protein
VDRCPAHPKTRNAQYLSLAKCIAPKCEQSASGGFDGYISTPPVCCILCQSERIPADNCYEGSEES